MGKGPETDLPPPSADDSSTAQRHETDVSLRAERHASDELEKGGLVEGNADRVVDLARERADAVLTDAREKADRDPPAPTAQERVDQERTDADELLEDERATADEILRRERQDAGRRLSALLPSVRQSTNRRLLTERESADAALSSRDDFLGMVSHDLNNLLGGIVLSASNLERRGRRGPAEASESQRIVADADRILLYAARMKRLVGDLVDVTSMTAGQLSVTPAPTEVRTLIAETTESFAPLAAENRLSLEAVRMDEPLRVACDRGRILQVLANLVGNAIKFTPPGGRISLRAQRSGEQVRVSVVDTGPGIAAPLLEAVFERFWQARTDDPPGLGLGLYIARAIIAAHHGRIWAESVVGEGSSFHFTLPAAAAPVPDR